MIKPAQSTERQTQQRAAITRFLTGATTPLTAEEIYRGLVGEQHRLNLSTVYRNLERMEKAGLVSTVKLAIDNCTRYILNTHRHVHHLICRGCRKAIPLDFCPLESIRSQSQDAQFVIEGHSFEVYGSCRECAAQSSAQESARA